MSSSQPVGKKAAISSFFSKNKQKKGGAAGGAGAYGAGDGSENSIIKSSDLGVPGVSDGAGAWDDTNNDADAQNTPDTALGGTAIASKLHMGVGDLEAEDEDLDDDEKIRRSIEAQDAR